MPSGHQVTSFPNELAECDELVCEISMGEEMHSWDGRSSEESASVNKYVVTNELSGAKSEEAWP